MKSQSEIAVVRVDVDFDITQFTDHLLDLKAIRRPSLRTLGTRELGMIAKVGAAISDYCRSASRELDRRQKEARRMKKKAENDRVFGPIRYWSKALREIDMLRANRLIDPRMVLAIRALPRASSVQR